MSAFKEGDPVSYESYGTVCRSIIARISPDGKIFHLANGRWIHSISAKPVVKQ